jgi:hypothetical protein
MTLGDGAGFIPEGLFRRMILEDGAGFTPENKISDWWAWTEGYQYDGIPAHERLDLSWIMEGVASPMTDGAGAATTAVIKKDSRKAFENI